MLQDSLYRTANADPYDDPVHASVFDDDPIRALSTYSRVAVVDADNQEHEQRSTVLVIKPNYRNNVVAIRTLLAVCFVFCLALAMGGSLGQGVADDWLGRIVELRILEFLGQASLGIIFVLTGMLTTHYCIHHSPQVVRSHVIAQTVGIFMTAVLPNFALIVVLANSTTPSVVFKVVLTVLPAWLLGYVTVALAFRSSWAKENVIRVAPVLLVISMIASFVAGVVMSHSSAVVGIALWGELTFTWSETITCMVHLSTYFFAGSFAVSIGGLLMRRCSILRFVLPVVGLVVFVMALPLAMAGLDIGQPFLALAIVPLVMLPTPKFLHSQQDAWLSLVLYGWPVYLVLMIISPSAQAHLITALAAVAVAIMLSLVAWWFMQKPLMDKLVVASPQTFGHQQVQAQWSHAEPTSARFRLLAVAEADKKL